jgi:hypothetical protein
VFFCAAMAGSSAAAFHMLCWLGDFEEWQHLPAVLCPGLADTRVCISPACSRQVQPTFFRGSLQVVSCATCCTCASDSGRAACRAIGALTTVSLSAVGGLCFQERFPGCWQHPATPGNTRFKFCVLDTLTGSLSLPKVQLTQVPWPLVACSSWLGATLPAQRSSH